MIAKSEIISPTPKKGIFSEQRIRRRIRPTPSEWSLFEKRALAQAKRIGEKANPK